MGLNTIDLDEAASIALRALGWALGDDDRASRLLALTGLDAGALRLRLDEPAVLAAILHFLEQHQPDLVACAKALGEDPGRLVAARAILDPEWSE